jgi:hypothetical protein
VWDGYFLLGEAVIYRTSLAVLSLLAQEHDLLSLSFGDAMRLLATGPLRLGEEQLMARVEKLRLSSKQTAELASVVNQG